MELRWSPAEFYMGIWAETSRIYPIMKKNKTKNFIQFLANEKTFFKYFKIMRRFSFNR